MMKRILEIKRMVTEGTAGGGGAGQQQQQQPAAGGAGRSASISWNCPMSSLTLTCVHLSGCSELRMTSPNYEVSEVADV